MTPKEIHRYGTSQGWADSYENLSWGPGKRYLEIMQEAFWQDPARKYEHLSGYKWTRYEPHTTECPYWRKAA